MTVEIDPHSLELRLLLCLTRVGSLESFSKAAESLGFTQSAISQQITRLERIVGQELVKRSAGPKKVVLTVAGEILCGHAEAIMARLASAAADLEAVAAGTAGVVRVGCYQSVGVRILPRILRDFSRLWPGVRVELFESEDDGELLREVENGHLDVAFIVFPLIPGPFAAIELLEDPYVVAVSEGSSLITGPGPVPLADLDHLPLITYGRIRPEHAIENRFGRPELAKQIVLRSNDNGTVLGMAAEGVGAAVVSWLSVDPGRRGIRVKALAGVKPRIVGIAWHRDRLRNPSVEAFIRVAQKEAFQQMELMNHHLSEADVTAGEKELP
ncbi:LysR family transcriptional regulator [Paeniglutamicibacter cryotolerans]|uniref:DNA-binding transcriptional LysR family regulator n=1 Tax=Paeniglutamicibacter cryotolerans TaxID=670079 RepID=A0A839QFT6_9MICC|nr:LysR family transcriptional regulator [Paeniglutamicibacter cryotolerans]MBB2994527.1 DNA-binding transcriptional LysR family regulator [Paeniglutamicibacter cryotolerans]